MAYCQAGSVTELNEWGTYTSTISHVSGEGGVYITIQSKGDNPSAPWDGKSNSIEAAF